MRSLEIIRDDTSYFTEDNCPGVRYEVPMHVFGEQPCWYSHRILTEGELDPPSHTINQLDRCFTCPHCKMCFFVIIANHPEL